MTLRARSLAPVALLTMSLPACIAIPQTETQSFTFEEPINQIIVDIDSGGVEIVATEDGRITVERTIRFTNARPGVETLVRGSALHLAQDCPLVIGFNVCEVEYRVRVPAGVKLQARAGAGDFVVSGLEGPLELFTGSGDIDVLAALRGVTAETSSGNIRLEEIAGGASARTGSGDISLREVTSDPLAPRLIAETSSGNIRLELLSGEVDARTGSGDISLRDIEGALVLETRSGNIEGSGLSAETAQAETGSGEIDLTLLSAPERLEMETSSGDITALLPGGAYRVDAQTDSGVVEIEQLFNDVGATRLIRARTGSGDISLRGR